MCMIIRERLTYRVPRLLLTLGLMLLLVGNTVVWSDDGKREVEALAEKIKKTADRTEKAERKNELVKDRVKIRSDKDGEPVIEQKGEASFYGPGLQGKKTASGEKFNKNDLTAAHPALPLGSEAKVTNLENGKSVRVEINDRGPHAKGRDIDLSEKAAKAIGLDKDGVAPVKIEAKIPAK